MNLKVGRAVLCAPTAATTLSYSAKNGAHGVTRPTSYHRFMAPMRVQFWRLKLSMTLSLRALFLLVAFAGPFVRGLNAQVVLTPKAAKGGEIQGEPWADVPASFRKIKIPEWPVPTDRNRWEKQDRALVRRTLLECLGEMPPRPNPRQVRVTSREDKGDYVLERFEFENGVDTTVPGILLIPKNLKGPASTIVALHGHGSSKESVCTAATNSQYVGPVLAAKGFVVAAIDAYFNGERVGKGPAGQTDDKSAQEASLFKLYLWQGRTLWGMMLRDEQCLLDYLETRPEVDSKRIGATGMSMGCTRSWWLSAIDDRVLAIVGVACFTRYTDLIAHGALRAHGIYYFVPGVFRHFDTEAIYALTAPRPISSRSSTRTSAPPPKRSMARC